MATMKAADGAALNSSTLDDALSALLACKSGQADLPNLADLTLSPADSAWAVMPQEELLEVEQPGGKFVRRPALPRDRPVVCTIGNCGRRFSSDNSLRNHIRRKHSSRAMLKRASEFAKRGRNSPAVARARLANLVGSMSPLSLPTMSPTASSPYATSAPLSPINGVNSSSGPLGLSAPLFRCLSVDMPNGIQDLKLSPQLSRRHSLYDVMDSPTAQDGPTRAVDDLKEWLAARICDVSNQLAHNQQRREQMRTLAQEAEGSQVRVRSRLGPDYQAPQPSSPLHLGLTKAAASPAPSPLGPMGHAAQGQQLNMDEGKDALDLLLSLGDLSSLEPQSPNPLWTAPVEELPLPRRVSEGNTQPGQYMDSFDPQAAQKIYSDIFG